MASSQGASAPNENRFYAVILDALNAPYRPQETAGRRQVQVLYLLRSIGLEMLMIDEVRHRLNTKLIGQNWDDFLRLAGSLKMGTIEFKPRGLSASGDSGRGLLYS